MKSFSAFLIGGTSSGSGKTTLTLGIMAALKARGLKVQPFKCGPDFIDPSLHKMVTGQTSPNLDLRMCGRKFCHSSFINRNSGKDVAVVEGVMGLFDGGIASSAALAVELKLPVILVVDARSAAESVAAVVKGFEVYSDKVEIAGVIFNRVGSTRHRELIEGAMPGVCKSEILGFFPRDIRFEIPDRHLGLYMGEENPLDDEQLFQLANAIETHLDLDKLLTISSRSSLQLDGVTVEIVPKSEKVRLAVARDKAFCFYYDDNFKILEQSGAELVFFSPLSDIDLPENCKGIYLGGGYPELYAEKLSANKTMLAAIHGFGESGGIIYGECGGFMYLCKQILSLSKQSYAMSGLLPFTVKMKPRLSRLGYRNPQLIRSCFFGEPGQDLHGHEFHYSELMEYEDSVPAIYQLQNNIREGYMYKNVLGGYLHLHFARSVSNINTFVNSLRNSSVIT
jgi:cobyrinic acid a,c-diamide synthase